MKLFTDCGIQSIPLGDTEMQPSRLNHLPKINMIGYWPFLLRQPQFHSREYELFMPKDKPNFGRSEISVRCELVKDCLFMNWGSYPDCLISAVFLWNLLLGVPKLISISSHSTVIGYLMKRRVKYCNIMQNSESQRMLERKLIKRLFHLVCQM